MLLYHFLYHLLRKQQYREILPFVSEIFDIQGLEFMYFDWFLVGSISLPTAQLYIISIKDILQRDVGSLYSWIAPPVHAHKINSQKDEKVMTNLRPRTENSRRGSSRSALTIFCDQCLASYFFKHLKTESQQK